MWLKLSGMLINMDLVETVTSRKQGGCELGYLEYHENLDRNIIIDESIDEVWAMMQKQRCNNS